MQAIALAHASPEEIDDDAQTAPSKRIIDQFPDYAGAKRIAGPQIAANIGLEKVRSKCPHFDAWLVKLKRLGADAPE
ncbi:MAG TPA: DUF4276 family protein [Blastocatellia bacterium]|nr:DUF4276 family protein [Blastocatellia bacterium]